MLPRAPLAARRHAQSDPDPALEGQARRSFERVERDRAGRHVGRARRRGRAGSADHHRDGQPHPARLRARFHVDHAPGRRAGNVAHAPPGRVRRAARRAAVDGQRAGRSDPRVGRRDRGRAAARPRVRRRRARRARAADQAARHPDHQVLDLQARTAARGRSARVSGRRGLRRGVGPAATVPAEPAQRRVGRIGQRHLPRRVARDRPRAGVTRRLLGRGGPRRRRRPPARRKHRGAPRASAKTSTRSSRGPAGSSSASRSSSRPRSSCATHRPRSPTRSARPGSPATPATRSGPCRPVSTCARSSTAPAPRSRKRAGYGPRARSVAVGLRHRGPALTLRAAEGRSRCRRAW